MDCDQNITIFPEDTEQAVNVRPENSESNVQIQRECLTVIPIEDKDYNRFYNKPQINGVELIGDKTLEELGIENDKNYVHNQTTSSDTWVIQHNLNKLPSVTVIDSAEEEVVGEITYNNINQLTIRFAAPFKGKATLN